VRKIVKYNQTSIVKRYKFIMAILGYCMLFFCSSLLSKYISIILCVVMIM